MSCTVRMAVRILAANSAAALLGPAMQVAFGPWTWRGLLRMFLISLVFANVIGGMANAMPGVWKRLGELRSLPRLVCIGLVLLACAIVGSLVACAILTLVGVFPAREYWAFYKESVKIAILITLLIGTGITIYEIMRTRLDQATSKLQAEALEKERAQNLAAEARIAALQAQIHPHFLFNALNSISALIPEDPQRAERLVEQIAALLRFSLDANQGGLVPLERELTIVSGYLEIEKARFGPRLRYGLDIPESALAFSVPPLSVQTLVENSVKHAVAPRRAGGEVHVRVETGPGSAIVLEISDDGPGFQLEEAPAGHGLSNLRSRLSALFGDGARLSVHRTGTGSVVRMELPA